MSFTTIKTILSDRWIFVGEYCLREGIAYEEKKAIPILIRSFIYSIENFEVC